MTGQAAVFLDRDGTLNVERGHVHTFDQWTWIDGAHDAIRRFRDKGYRVVVITNQAGVARGMYTEDDVLRLHELVQEDLRQHGTEIDAFYYCPHHPDFGPGCSCRKPKPGLIDRAEKDLALNLAESLLLGDSITDIEAGLARGIQTVLVQTGYGPQQLSLIDRRKTLVVRNVHDAALQIGNLLPHAERRDRIP